LVREITNEDLLCSFLNGIRPLSPGIATTSSRKQLGAGLGELHIGAALVEP
jgi:hypothetical protein